MAEMIESDETGIAAETNTKVDSPEVTSPSKTATEECIATSKSKGYTWLLLGVTGAGKSCLGNFLLGDLEGNAFQESEEFKILQAETKTASYKDGIACDSGGLKWNLRIIDTPILGDTQYLGKYDSKAKDIAEDTSTFAIELTKMMMWMRGIIAFLIVIPSHVREHSGTMNMLDCFEILGNYWDHAILVLTQGKKIGRTEDDQYEYFEDVVKGPQCPPIWEILLKKVKNRYIIVEGKDWRHALNYRNSVHRKLMSFSDDVTTQHGPYHDNLNSIGNKAVEKAKLELREKYDNFQTQEAERAISKLARKHLMKVTEKLVRIKLSGGVDVDKLKEINEVKQRELENLSEETENLRRKCEKEVEKRKMAEEIRLKEERSRIKAELEAKHEIERRKEAEERNILAELNKILIEKLLNAAEEEKQQAKQKKSQEVEKRKIAEQQKEDERLKREQAEQQKEDDRLRREQLAEQQKEDERLRREQAEQQKEDERLRREQAKQHKEDERLKRERAEQQKEDERLRREQAEQQMKDERLRREQAEQQMEDERLRREQAEQQREDERLRRVQAG